MSNYQISKSSLLSLKAEILRKQEEVKGKIRVNEKKKVPLVIKNKGVEKRNERDTIEDLDALEQSRIALEKKAKLYEKLSKSKVIDDNPASFQNRFLVRFNDKNKDEPLVNESNCSEDEDLSQDYDDPSDSNEKWVEYVDCLGRTRTCLKKDLQYFQSRDKDYKRNELNQEEPEVIDEVSEVKDSDENLELLSDDMRRDLLRQQWEKEENELRDKDNIHYQDVLFSEARTHGVGYYAFSKDEEMRRRQQASLQKLREESQREQKKCQDLKIMREQQLAARVKAAKMRKRARLGLPVEDEEEEEPEIGPSIPEATQEPEISEDDALKERLLEEARRNHIRPWDIGKEKVNEFYEYTQTEWVEKKRKERNDEFAPPSAYRRDFQAVQPELEVPKSEGSLRFTTKKTEKINQQFVNPYKNINEDMQDPFNEETRTFNPYQPAMSRRNKRKFQDETAQNITPDFSIPNQTFNENVTCRASTVESDEVSQKDNSVEDIYKAEAHTSTGKVKIHSEEKTPQNIQASIEAGLKFLRKQAEKKGSIRDHENDDMFAL
ncbi:hypothetical protein HHI36_012643 [Cryptolaemus montrouzieri]|uniref:CCDC174 alpha/beta GRSR domain-containing protein n=1 Tax=Cryptolaemus montrouzieri TaxID=559131 RepID=A0ABD2NEU8_9CUCU